MRQRNSVHWEADEAMTAIRAGQGLLVGLLRCGHCGRKLHVRYWGGTGTHARYLCKGDYDDGGQYCLGFGGSLVDRRISDVLLEVISPLGVAASIQAIEALRAGETAQQAALARKLEQLEYEARRAFEQYDVVDARNRLAAAELERRWNEKLEEIELVRQQLAGSTDQPRALSPEEEARILALGESFGTVWQSEVCPPALKKKIFRTVLEEILVRTDREKKTLHFTLHWKGGVHTQLEMDRPRSATETATSLEALDIIRRMAVCHGDDQIASVLNRLGYSTGKGNRWNQNRVATARKNHAIAGQKRAVPDPEKVSLNEAARLCGVSHRSLERLVEAGLLNREQVTPRAPWQIRRSALEAEPVRRVLDHLRRTGKLVLPGGRTETQTELFLTNQVDDNDTHSE
jgi:Recombinase zinc beta ribbon domain